MNFQKNIKSLFLEKRAVDIPFEHTIINKNNHECYLQFDKIYSNLSLNF